MAEETAEIVPGLESGACRRKDKGKKQQRAKIGRINAEETPKEKRLETGLAGTDMAQVNAKSADDKKDGHPDRAERGNIEKSFLQGEMLLQRSQNGVAVRVGRICGHRRVVEEDKEDGQAPKVIEKGNVGFRAPRGCLHGARSGNHNQNHSQLESVSRQD